jgi:hypothetical protein
MADEQFEETLGTEIGDIIRQHVAAATKPLRDRIAALEARADAQCSVCERTRIWLERRPEAAVN